MSAVFLVGVSVLLIAGAHALAGLAMATATGALRFDLVTEVATAAPRALPAPDVLDAAPKTSPPR